jgi:hypothetical protein
MVDAARHLHDEVIPLFEKVGFTAANADRFQPNPGWTLAPGSGKSPRTVGVRRRSV